MYLNRLNISSLFKGTRAFFRVILLAIICNITCILKSSGQSTHPDTLGNNFLFETVAAFKNSMVNEQLFVTISDTAIHQIFDKFKPDSKNKLASAAPKSPLILGVKLNPSLSKYYSMYVQAISKHYQTFAYVNHIEGPYSIADDALIIQNDLIINRSGFQKIRHGRRLPKQYQETMAARRYRCTSHPR